MDHFVGGNRVVLQQSFELAGKKYCHFANTSRFDKPIQGPSPFLALNLRLYGGFFPLLQI